MGIFNHLILLISFVTFITSLNLELSPYKDASQCFTRTIKKDQMVLLQFEIKAHMYAEITTTLTINNHEALKTTKRFFVSQYNFGENDRSKVEKKSNDGQKKTLTLCFLTSKEDNGQSLPHVAFHMDGVSKGAEFGNDDHSDNQSVKIVIEKLKSTNIALHQSLISLQLGAEIQETIFADQEQIDKDVEQYAVIKLGIGFIIIFFQFWLITKFIENKRSQYSMVN